MEKELLETALQAARRAGDVLVERLGEHREVATKGYRDEVTDADTAAEAAILSLIHDRFPDHAVISEEAGGHGEDAPCVWLVDPLDGTTNYARGHPTFSVSIAVTSAGKPIVGVVHDPLRQHTFAALRDGGATLNGRPIHSSGVDRLDQALVGLDWAHADADRLAILGRLAILAPHCRTIRSLGSAALALAYLGAGWLDAYFASGLHPWDTAAASLIVTQAGGRITGLDGETWSAGQPALLAANRALHEQVLGVWGGPARREGSDVAPRAS